jgi:hypothetical protein
MKRINPKAFMPLLAGKPVTVARDLIVYLEKPGTIWAVWDGGETCLGHGSVFNIGLTGSTDIKATENGSYYATPGARCEPRDEPSLTNETKRPNHSAAMEYVLREVRMMKMENRRLQVERDRANLLTPEATAEGPSTPEASEPGSEDSTQAAAEPEGETREAGKPEKRDAQEQE